MCRPGLRLHVSPPLFPSCVTDIHIFASQFPQLSFHIYMASRVPCTCSCGLEVSYTTKQNHLNAHGKISLRVRVMTEMGSLNRNTQQQQKPTSLLQRGFRKQASSNPDQDGSCKRRKAAQLEGNQLPEITASSQVDTDLM